MWEEAADASLEQRKYPHELITNLTLGYDMIMGNQENDLKFWN